MPLTQPVGELLPSIATRCRRWYLASTPRPSQVEQPCVNPNRSRYLNKRLLQGSLSPVSAMRSSPIVLLTLYRDLFWVLFSFLGRFSSCPVPDLLSVCYQCLRYRSFVLFLYRCALQLSEVSPRPHGSSSSPSPLYSSDAWLYPNAPVLLRCDFKVSTLAPFSALAVAHPLCSRQLYRCFASLLYRTFQLGSQADAVFSSPPALACESPRTPE